MIANIIAITRLAKDAVIPIFDLIWNLVDTNWENENTNWEG